MIGVFDRSHYEAELAAEGVTLVKCIPHISKHEQRDRLETPATYYDVGTQIATLKAS